MARPTGARALTETHRVESETIAYTAARAASSKKGQDIRILDLGELLGITDFFVLLSARNERQLGTVAEEIEHQLKRSGQRPVHTEGTRDSGWIVLDYGGVVIHAFSEDQRAFYGLERLWSDAPELAFSESEHVSV